MEIRFPRLERFPRWKIVFLQYAIALTLLGLVFGYWRLQIAQHRLYEKFAEQNRIRNIPIIAPRGRILDCNGRVLVDNTPAFNILLTREGEAPLTPQQIDDIARGLELDPADVTNLIHRSARIPYFQPIVLKQSASLQDVSFVESHLVEFPQLDVVPVQQRFYPLHEVAASVLGHVGEVSEDMISKPGSHYRPGDVVGKSGIEREYDSLLSGKDGMQRVVVDSRGRRVGTLAKVDAVPGKDLRLTIDLNLQMVAEASLGARPGAVVALDPQNGQVLAMVSHPSFDPNDFAHHISSKVWHQLTSDPEKPLMNKAIQAQLAPGSVFKIITATAALETGVIKPNFTVYCPGHVKFYGHTFHDWKKGGHGTVDLHRAIVMSCDVYFYTLGKMLGIDKLAYFAKALGLGSKTGIDLPGEDAGLIPTPEWVRKVYKHRWWPGETISVAIGQGPVTVTPLQVAYAIGGIVLGGEFYRPHLVFRNELHRDGIDPPQRKDRRFPLENTTVDAIRSGMWGVVNQGGTGWGARCPGIDIAGKTGTAQVVSAGLRHSTHDARFRNNAWFVGFSPTNDPQIVVSVLVMRGEHSSVAAPIARDVIKAYYEEKLPKGVPGALKQPEVRLLSQLPGGDSQPPDTSNNASGVQGQVP